MSKKVTSTGCCRIAGVIAFFLAFLLHGANIKLKNGRFFKNVCFLPTEKQGFIHITADALEKPLLVRFADLPKLVLVTADGTTFTDAEIISFDKQYIAFSHAGGLARIEIDELDEKCKKLFSTVSVADRELRVRQLAEAGQRRSRLKQTFDFLQKLKTAKANWSPGLADSGNKPVPFALRVLIISGENGAGSGFYVNLWGIRAVVSNAHVFTRLKALEVKDGNGRRFKIKNILIAKTADLVILDVDAPGNIIPFEMIGNVAKLRLNSKIAAYGNSLGEGVITASKGQLLGIGPKRIEIDAKITPGCSGGPVLSGNKVAGVVAFAKKINVNKALLHGASAKTAERRFALRIDNLNIDDFQPVSAADIDKDFAAFDKVKKLYLLLLSFKFSIFKEEVLENYKFIEYGDRHKWTVIYLKNCYKKLRGDIELATKLLKLEAKIKEKQISDAWSKYSSEITVRKIKRDKKKCSKCNGSGFVKKQVPNFNYDPRRMGKRGRRYSICSSKCSSCRGRGFFYSTQTSACKYDIPPGLYRILSNNINKTPVSFNGHYMGEDYAVVRRFFSRHYHSFPHADYNGLIKKYSFKGNQKIKEASKTSYLFAADKLIGIELILPYSAKTYQMTSQALGKKKESDGFRVYIIRKNTRGGRKPVIRVVCHHDMFNVLKNLPNPACNAMF